MKQIIEEVFEAEKNANEIIKKARQKASEVKQAAEKDNLEKIAQAKQEAKDIIHNAVENAKKEAELVRQEQLQQAENDKEKIVGNKAVLNELVENICNIIINTEDD